MYADSDILPIAIINAETVWPENSNLKLRSGTVVLRIGKPISTKKMTVSDIDDISKKTKKAIEELLTYK